ncbi:glycosyltransferase [Modestobacter sp. I12A-02628]|uniref:Glycosyltransferase family 4 protein n=1 Tax=Goekera deserti TaxID=2497753 RepID=A0A7K3WA62_9ACTN|nr:glycosyltransferase family 4 protein [Goekera deserti]MPQ99195.1 glycosyltransferase [Goekera deserti]NDI47530.1 glycosyltransferase [Goekera deserti]NEL53341.1 glycosyltransferase family 4 protein [Goekera deserti]
MRVGLVCPYQWDVPGGVQYHVRDLAETLRAQGHHVEVLTPAEHEESLPAEHVTFAGRTVPVPYNGSMASMQFGPISAARVRRWLREGSFDVVHVHEPVSPSVSLLVCMIAKGPIVATFHAASVRSKWLAVIGPWARPWVERISGRIAVSDFARRLQVEHLGGDAVIIPNGVHVDRFAHGPTLPGLTRGGAPLTIGFLGRYDEPRKGLAVLLEAMPAVLAAHPGTRLLIAGRGDAEELHALVGPELGPAVTLLGELSEADKAAFLRSVDVYCAPNLLGESFGVILIEAMAAGAPIVASDLDAFTRVLRGGDAGVLVRRGDPGALAAALVDVLGDPARRAALAAAGSAAARAYDWSVVSERIVAVYETVVLPGAGAVSATEAGTEALLELLPRPPRDGAPVPVDDDDPPGPPDDDPPRPGAPARPVWHRRVRR